MPSAPPAGEAVRTAHPQRIPLNRNPFFLSMAAARAILLHLEYEMWF
jgi:hypothetical protein